MSGVADSQSAVAEVTVVFTDLRASTRLYHEVGDEQAVASVVSHFAVLNEAFRAEGGVLVKTMGDAAMAVFESPAAALRAVLSAQESLASGNRGRSLVLKAGIHHGPCISLPLNGRLDYFGSTVNAAARLVGLASGHDVVVSGPVLGDPGTADVLAERADAFRVDPLEAALKGFDEERLELWRVASIRDPLSAAAPNHDSGRTRWALSRRRRVGSARALPRASMGRRGLARSRACSHSVLVGG